MAKTSVSFAQFFYRVNPDTTIDAICGYCFLTVATANTRTELRLIEAAHHCGNSLSTRAAFNRPGFGDRLDQAACLLRSRYGNSAVGLFRSASIDVSAAVKAGALAVSRMVPDVLALRMTTSARPLKSAR
jgi:hypothetical protein